MKKHLSTIVLVAVFLAGVCLLLYPTVSDYWNSLHQTRAIGAYEETLTDMTEKDYSAYFDQADAYNEALAALSFPLADYKQLSERADLTAYAELLDVGGTGVMGYIDIDAIGVELPIYHGTDAAVLNVAVGHLEGSSLPVGGAGTHCVLSAHRGLPSARLFTDLDKLKLGDTFKITVLNRLITYEVDQILIVNPDAVDALAIEEGGKPLIAMSATVAFVNPFSKHREAAIEYLELTFSKIDKTTRIALMPGENEPILSPWYEENLKYYDETIADYEAQLADEKLDEENRDMLEQSLADMKQWREEYEKKGQWQVSAEDIERYREYAQYLVPMRSAIWNDGGYSQISQYMDGAITAKQLCSEMEKTLQMQRLEGQ